jgi:hypothetical protein
MFFELLEPRTLLASDFGDAPDTGAGTGTGNYQTLLADNGPRHDITTTQTTLFLGARVDGETDAVQNTRANGDDTSMLPDDEDGLVEPAQDLLLTVGSVPTVRVRATNTTGSAATLYGWIDINRDGVFDNPSERTSVTVPTATTNGTFTLTFPLIPVSTPAGATYARFRLSSDVAAANSTGAAVDGEVEDYAATITRRSDGTVDNTKTTKIASGTSGGPTLTDGDFFGRSAASLDDLDGDGVTDLAVGARYDDTGGTNRGAVYVQFMKADGTVKSSVKIASGTNGGPTLADDDQFGISVASLGDLDGDGVTDLAVGARYDDTGGTNRGAVYVQFMKADGTVKSGVKIASATNGGPMLPNGDGFGSSVASLGDLDGDGVTDLVVGAQSNNTGGTARGAVYVLLLNTNGTVKSSAKIASGTNGGPTLADADNFGNSLAALGDLDGDGVTDLAVGANLDDTSGTDRGAVYVLLMNVNSTVKSSVKIASGTNGGLTLANHDRFGSSVASLGDLDGDGVTDLAVGARTDGTGGSYRGAVHVMLLNASGTVKSSVKIASGLNGGPTLVNFDNFGISVASLGDLDGDGVTDLAVGANRDDTGGSDRGAVYVLFLNPPRDFGDAPDTGAGTGTGNYETLLVNNGPRHDIATTQTTLFLGARVDGEVDAIQNTRANGDDITTLPDDEDGLVEPAQDLLLTVGTAPVVRVRATNATASAATIYGWIDYNRDGVFDNATERASVAVPSASTPGTFSLTFPPIPPTTSGGATYARFRLSSDPMASNATGAVAGGEVEDYPATMMARSYGTVDGTTGKKIASEKNGGPLLANGDNFGVAIAPLGDLDGDGVIDLAVGVPGDDTGGSGRGAVDVLFMNADGTVKSSVKIASGTGGGPSIPSDDEFGISLAALGDLDGDGVIDLAVGAASDNTGGVPNTGAVYVLFLKSDGTAKGSVKIASGLNGGPVILRGEHFGWSVAAVGDLDGDGVVDLAVGAIHADGGGFDKGSVYLLRLNSDGTVKNHTSVSNGSGGALIVPDFDTFGYAIASLGDLDGDGVTDLAVGAPFDDTNGSYRGATYILLMNAGGSVKNSVKFASGVGGAPALANNSSFGSTVAAIGDLDGDGVMDLGVGAVGDESSGGFNRGAFYVLLLNANGTLKQFTKIADGLGEGVSLTDTSYFGRSAALLGDLNGDGLNELAIGAPGDDVEGSNRGAIYLFSLNPPLDFGDAPDTGPGAGANNYLTLLADNGPRHEISTTQTTLYLGARVDGEVDANPNARGTGDDLTALPDDEDGVVEPAQDFVLTVGAAPRVRVRATNATGTPAMLYGWIDYNRDGVFDNGTEHVSVTVPPETANGTFALQFPEIPAGSSPGATMARFRLSSDPAAANAIGVAVGGEVEDYPATILLASGGSVDNSKTKKIASEISGGPTLANGDYFGSGLVSLGDLDGDGVLDLAVGARYDDTGGNSRGAVYVQFMLADGTVKSSVKIGSGLNGGPTLANNDFFGSSLASLGDLDGDGATDIAVGANGDNSGGADRGAVYIVRLNLDGTAKSSLKIAQGMNGGPSLANGDYFGRSVASIGDLNGDGITDLMVGTHRDDTGGTNCGAVYILFLNSDGSVKARTKIASAANGGPTLASGDYFGVSVASLGDLDGDGITDVAIGAFRDDTGGSNRGAVHVLMLNPNGTVKNSVKVASGLNGGPVLADGDDFGRSVVAIGDLNADGVTDMAAGASRDHTGGTDRGALYVLLMNNNGTVLSNLKVASDTNGGPTLSDGDRFGVSLAYLGDFNGDSRPDLAVGANGDDAGGVDRGAVYSLFLGLLPDFGDAPDSGLGTGTGNYQTKLADDGPRHDITTTQTTLFLGGRVDGETDAVQNARANGDDITNLPDDEDGLVEPAQDLLLTVGSAPTVRVRATNTTGTAATLYGWIDFNRDGVFDNATERTSIPIPTATINGTFTLVFPTIPLSAAAGTTYARFRLSSDAAGANSTGGASGGEVEDYAATITKRSDGTVDSAKTKKIAGSTNGGPILNFQDFFGSAVASIGDLDGDSVTDIAVGARLDNTGGSNSGAVYVEFLNPNGSVKGSVKIASGTNGGPTLATNDYFGRSVASLGDLDGDGIADLAVGAIRNTGGSDRGAVYVLFLNSNGTVKSSKKIASGTNGGPILANDDLFGHSLATVGDLDGDGITDLAVGAAGDDTGGTNRGAVYVLFMDADGTVKSSVKIGNGTNGGPTLSDDDGFCASLASLGDIDGDGITDLAVGASGDSSSETKAGAVYVLMLNANGTVKTSVKIAPGMNGAPALTANGFFGSSAASVGDIDGDGTNDLTIGAYFDNSEGSQRGALYTLLLHSNGTVKRSLKIASEMNGGPALPNGGRFGTSMASLGDLNGDGVTDLAVGAERDSTGVLSGGAVHVLFLNALTVTDFGDAPDTGIGTGIGNHETLLTSNGPRHDITRTQDALYLGARVDGEDDATVTGQANGDDITTLPDDEDGLIEPAQELLLTVGAVPNIRLRATNATDSAATLYGWIDYNRDGQFDNATERTSVTVPPATNNGTFVLTFPTIPTSTLPGATYARFRLSTDVAAANATGLASGGEVEDYAASIMLRSDGTADSAKNKKIASGVSGGPTLVDGDRFGLSVAALSDLDGDGVTDLAVGAYRDDTNGTDRGAVYVQFMNANGTVKSSVKIASGTNGGPTLTDGDYFGWSIASLGDLDGDGVTDLAVGAYRDDTEGMERGAVYILLLNADGDVKSGIKIASGTTGSPTLADGDRFGSSVASLGDLDGDGVTDLAVGATHDDANGANRGAVHVLMLNANGTVKSWTKIASGTNGGPQLMDGDFFGTSVATLGDLDEDGVTDLAVGAFGDDTEGTFRGAVHVLLLKADGTVKSSVKIASGTNGGPVLTDGDRFGSSLASKGDLDGDGVTDLVVGAFLDDTGGSARGAVYVQLMNTNGSVKSSVKIASGTNGGPTLTDGDAFGRSAALLGDLDEDGVTELAVGAYSDNTGGPNRGAVHVLFLKQLNHAPTRIDATASLGAVSEDTTATPGDSVSNLFGSLFADADGTTIATGGVAIITNAATAAQGTWQVKVGAGEFTDLPLLTDSTAVIVLGVSDLIRFVPAFNFNGIPGSLTTRLWDGTSEFTASTVVQDISTSIGGSGAFSDSDNEVTLSTAIIAVNDPPSFESLVGDYSAADENPLTRGPALQQAVPGWALNILAGPPDEAVQELNFVVTNDNNSLFAIQPAIDSSGTLTYTPAPNMHGTAVITVMLEDDGGGDNSSAQTSFNIVITKTHRLHNAAELGKRNGLDVTGSTTAQPDGFIVAGDVLAVINYINSKGSGTVPPNARFGPPYPDVNGDNEVVAGDALAIINYINAGNSSEGEAAATSPDVFFTNFADTDASAAAVLDMSPSVSRDTLTDVMALLAMDSIATQSKRRRIFA